jgi:tryptophanyl-tRNA synthetase
MTDQGTTAKRIFSGVQPTGGLHLGNYLGAVRNFVDLQGDYECVYCVVDLHAITVWQDPTKLADQTREITAAFLASGIDPKTSIIFNQSQVRAHAELGWIFNCVARVGWLNRMTQFKDKAGKNREAASMGLYGYPVLQAADILTYLATHVPVGEDQKQHLELTRDIAAKFNNDFGVDFFPMIEPLIMGAAARIMSLRDGSKKMSKSEPSDMSRINLHDDADAIANKIRRAKTDPQALPGAEVLDEHGAITDAFAKERPEAANLVTIYAALGRQSLTDVLNELAGKSFSDFKGMLTDRAVDQMAPIGSEMQRLMNDPAHIDAVLKDGAERARAIADPVIDQVYDIVGLLRA